MFNRNMIMVIGSVVILSSLFAKVARGADSNRLIIDGSSYGKQIRTVCIMSSLTESVDIVTAKAKAKWITVNRKGDAVVCIPGGGTNELFCRFNEAGKISTPRITEAPGIAKGYSGNLSPDGSMLCFVRIDGRSIGVINIADGQVANVFTADGPVSEASWSPDGKALAYYYGNTKSYMDDSFSVGISEQKASEWIHKTIAPESKPCHRSPTRIHAPLWGPSGKAIVFEARYKDEEKGPQTYLVDIDSRGLQWVTGAESYGSFPSSSALYNGIIYSEIDQGIFLYEIDSKKRRRLVEGKGLYCPVVSFDGALLAYSDERGAIHISAIDGSEDRIIFNSGAEIPVSRFYWY